MIDLFFDIPLKHVGWAFVHFTWISTLFLGGTALVLKIFEDSSHKLQYNIGLGALFSLPCILGLLLTEHSSFLPPIGLADWDSSTEGQTASEPLFEGLPQFSGIELAPGLYKLLGIIWILTATIMLGYFFYSLIMVQLKYRKKPHFNDQLIYDNLEELAHNLGISKRLNIRYADYDLGPAVAGFIRPYILLPSSLTNDYNAKEQKALLFHELIHIKRNDYLVASLQRIIHSIFFFQPLVFWLSRKIDLQREYICDDEVINMTDDAYSYGNLLVKLQLRTQSTLATTLNISGHDTVDRIERLTNDNSSSATPVQRYIRNCVAFLIIGVTLFSSFWNSYHIHYNHTEHLQSSGNNSEWIRSN